MLRSLPDEPVVARDGAILLLSRASEILGAPQEFLHSLHETFQSLREKQSRLKIQAGASNALKEDLFRSRYPTFFDFLECFFWPGADGGNLLKLIVAVQLRSHPDRARRLAAECREMSQDTNLSDSFLAQFMLRDAISPYRLANDGSIRDFLWCLAELLVQTCDSEQPPRSV